MTEKRFVVDDDGIVTDMLDLSMYIDNDDCCDKLNELDSENQMLKKTNKRTESTYHALQKKFHNWDISLSKCREENKELKAKVDDKEVAVEVETCKIMEKVFALINAKIKLYSHKPVSAPISQPMSVNFDADVDRLARLSELEALKEELEE